MGDKTGIEWTRGDDGIPGATWNPTTGCDQLSPGCDHCYALGMAARLKAMGQANYQTDGDPRTSGPGFGIAEHPHMLSIPLRWRRPRRVFVNSMSDLFHDGVSDEFVARVFAVMAAAPMHTFQLLTKRHGRMRSLLSDDRFRRSVQARIPHEAIDPYVRTYSRVWPLPNVHLVVSVEDQRWAGIRIPALLATPAAVRGVSCEPLLGGVDLGASGFLTHDEFDRGIDWVIVGGESGPGARPMEIAWARSLRDQCAAAGVPFFMKQLGSVAARDYGAPGKGDDPVRWPSDLRVREYPEAVSLSGELR